MRGYLDLVTSAGFVEGWAFDEDDVMTPARVTVHAESGEVARGTANRYRADLAAAGCGTGWCAFRLILSAPPATLEGAPVWLHDAASGALLHTNEATPLIEEAGRPLATLAELIGDDPTVIHDIEQLRGCEPLFASIIATAGAERFLRVSVNYLLNRPMYAEDMTRYLQPLATGALSPMAFLKELSGHDVLSPLLRLLPAPTEPGFAFRRP